MASTTDIWNMALSHIGHRANVVSSDPPDSTVEAGLCARFYPTARALAIESASWTFARTRAQLANVSNPSNTWAYAYAKPSDCLRPLRVISINALSVFHLSRDADMLFTLVPDEHEGAPFELEGSTILSNEPEAVLLYLRDVTDTGAYTPLFVLGLSQMLSSLLAGAIIKGKPGADARTDMLNQARATLASAATRDARTGGPQPDYMPAHLRARA
ncbi:MAG: hypothetical protein RLZZ524_449 [Pseudomonadota bacterium]|jgi:hypothetical protein